MLRYSKIAALALPPLILTLALFVFMQATAPACPSCPVPDSQTKAAFDRIYETGAWGKKKGVGVSGSGSTLAATEVYRRYLEVFMKEHGIKSVVDAGCGDWEFSQKIDWTGIDYKGYDIVETVIAANKRQFAKPNVQFFTANIVDADLPPADLLIVKHVLQHLPTADVQKFLHTQLGKYKHVLITDSVNAQLLPANNRDIEPGQYRELDVTLPPFGVPGTKELLYMANKHMHQVVHLDNTVP
jgi:SAM-dependent methyltransferase